MFGFRYNRKRVSKEIAPDEIFLDSSNLPNFNRDQFEGRIEKPIGRGVITIFSAVLVLIALSLLYKTFALQIVQGDEYREQAENNRLSHEIIFAERGIIADRNGIPIAWNEPFSVASSSDEERDFARRTYATTTGFAHIVGYVTYPQKDSAGFYFQEETKGIAGVEKIYDESLAGIPGRNIIEEDARGEVISTSLFEAPVEGDQLALTIDAELSDKLATLIKSLAENVGFSGGSSVIIDVRTGEVLALVSVPEYDPEALANGNAEAIAGYSTDPRTPFINRAVSGLYTPGSIMKPFFAIGALEEGVIHPEKEIYSDGALRIPNPYNPSQPTIMKDWKAHGWTDMREALAVSSDVYFYQIGGGFGDQKGLGIKNIEKYSRLFGVAERTGIDVLGEVEGTIPSIEWKEEIFPGDPWRVGDTYNTSIGQYGFQVTPIQMARATAAIANGGLLVTPHVLKNTPLVPGERVPVEDTFLQIAREGMRLAVLEGTSRALAIGSVEIAAKSGTAELGLSKRTVNSWLVGFWPYENPRYAFATVMERGPVTNLVGSASVMRQFFDWLTIARPEYL